MLGVVGDVGGVVLLDLLFRVVVVVFRIVSMECDGYWLGLGTVSWPGWIVGCGVISPPARVYAYMDIWIHGYLCGNME